VGESEGTSLIVGGEEKEGSELRRNLAISWMKDRSRMGRSCEEDEKKERYLF